MKIWRSLYNNNPFYLVSALLVLFGLRSLFPPGDSSSYDWAVMASLLFYISLLAATSVVIIRAGSVWEDARSILLVILFLMVALSVNFDEKVISSPGTGKALLAGGLAFSILVSEVLLRGLRIRLAPLLRGPYHLLLATFFVFPAVLADLLYSGDPARCDLVVPAFPVVFGLGLLSLVPAVRRGPQYTRENGTPWRWPLFPWIPFAFLALCAVGRSFYLGVSFSTGKGIESSFAPYFVSPILLASSVLVLEGGLIARSRAAQLAALAAPLLLPLLALVSTATLSGREMFPGLPTLTGSQRLLLDRLAAAGAPPALITLGAIGAFYLYACLRRAPLAGWGLALAVLGFAVVGPGTVDLATLTGPRAAPVAAASAVVLALAIVRPASWKYLLAAAGAVAAGAIAFPAFSAHHVAVPVHLLIGAALAVGYFFSDAFARAARDLAGGAVVVVLVVLLYLGDVAREMPAWQVVAYAAVAPVLLGLYGYATGAPSFFRLAVVAALVDAPRCIWALASGVHGLRWTRGTWMVLGGVAAFAAGAAISLSKAGLLGRRRPPAGPAPQAPPSPEPPPAGGSGPIGAPETIASSAVPSPTPAADSPSIATES